MSNIRNDKEKLKEILMKYVKTDNKGRVLLSKDDEWRNETEWDETYKEERPCTVLQSIEEGLEEIKEYKEGKRTFRTLEESRKMWAEWIAEIEKEMSKKDVEDMIDKCINGIRNDKTKKD